MILQQKKYKILSVAFSFLVLYFLFYQINLSNLTTVFSKIHWDFILLALVVYVLLNLARSLRFYFLLDKRIRFWHLFHITSAHALMLNILPARSGELFYIYQIRKSKVVGADYNVSSLLISRIFDTLIVCILMVLSLYFVPALMGVSRVIWLTGLAFGLAFILFLFFIFSEKALIKLINFIFTAFQLHKWHWSNKLLTKIREILVVAIRFRQSSIFALTFLLTIFIWVLIAMMYWLMADGFGLHLDFWQIIFMIGLPTLVSIVPFYTLGNFGIFEGSSALALVVLGIGKELAISFSFAVHILRILISFIPGVISYLFLSKKDLSVSQTYKSNNRMLFITQKIDKSDDVLGTYHCWVKELSQKLAEVNVICLYKGVSELPASVRVYSLGKERNVSKLKYILNFYRYIWKLRKRYDVVFVHMNPIYIILGGLFWKLSGKKIFFWYNHPMGNLKAKLGAVLAGKIFCTSSQSFFAKHKKIQLMPVGIDTESFKRIQGIPKKENRILCLGRISPIKKIEYLIKAVKILDKNGIDFELLIVGAPISNADKIYYKTLMKLSGDLLASGKIIFKPAVSNYKTPEFYNSASLYINLTPSGSFDKAILEAMACQLPVIMANKVFMDIFSEEFKKKFIFIDEDAEDLARKIALFFKETNNERQAIGESMRQLVVRQHSLSQLIARLFFVSKLND